MSEIYSLEQAAQKLGTNRKSLGRLISKGVVKAIKADGRYFISEDQVTLLKLKDNARNLLNGRLEEIYVLRRHGVSQNECSEVARQDCSTIDLAVERYEEERSSHFGVLGIKDSSPYLLGKEVAARIRVKDYNLIDRLIREGQINARRVQVGKRLFYLTIDESFKKYLGKDLHNPFYTSSEISKITGLKVQFIDKFALQNNLGRKTTGTKNSQYLFIHEEVEFFKSVSQNRRRLRYS